MVALMCESWQPHFGARLFDMGGIAYVCALALACMKHGLTGNYSPAVLADGTQLQRSREWTNFGAGILIAESHCAFLKAANTLGFAAVHRVQDVVVKHLTSNFAHRIASG